MGRIECFLVEKTGEMTEFHEGVSSPVVRRVDTGELFHKGWGERPGYRPLPAGAMWTDPDLGLTVRTPGGDWHVDRPSSSGGRWTRSGDPPRITATPSILFSLDRPTVGQRSYHGFLTDGFLVEC